MSLKELNDKREKIRARGDLPEQRLERLMKSLNTRVPHPKAPGPPESSLQMEQHVLLHCPEIPDMRYYLEGRKGCPDEPIPDGPTQLGLVVSATVSHVDFEERGFDRIEDGTSTCCSPIREPYTRNVFIIKPVDMAKTGWDHLLTYGREFYLQLAHGYRKMYLRSETPLIDGQFGPRDHNPVRLSVNRDCYCKWKALYWNKSLRFETEGAPIQPCARVVIQHVMSGMCLAAEKTVWHRSLIGLEAGISVYSYRNVDHIEDSECIWNFLVGDDPNDGPVEVDTCEF